MEIPEEDEAGWKCFWRCYNVNPLSTTPLSTPFVGGAEMPGEDEAGWMRFWRCYSVSPLSTTPTIQPFVGGAEMPEEGNAVHRWFMPVSGGWPTLRATDCIG